MILHGKIIADENLIGDVSQDGVLDGEITGDSSLIGNLQESRRPSFYSHPDLALRDIPNQHPQNAITNLAEDMALTPKEIITDAEIWNL